VADPRRPITLPAQGHALAGHAEPLEVSGRHFVNGRSYLTPYPKGHEIALFGLGCFWGAERVLWQQPGVYATAVGYAGGETPNPTYKEVCSGLTGHTEVVLVIFDPAKLSYAELLVVFWESHDPTQGMRQGNDVGTQYRSAIYAANDAQQAQAEASRANYQAALSGAGRGRISTEIGPMPMLYFAEDYHQQYLAKNPNGYCGIGGCGVPFKLAELPVGEKAEALD
jgi:peptide-methionine (S)-S-oxide reductase